MTDDTATQDLPLNAVQGQPAAEDAPPKKAAPRRKAAARKPAADAPDAVVVSGTDEAGVAPVRKPRAPRKKAAVKSEEQPSLEAVAPAPEAVSRPPEPPAPVVQREQMSEPSAPPVSTSVAPMTLRLDRQTGESSMRPPAPEPVGRAAEIVAPAVEYPDQPPALPVQAHHATPVAGDVAPSPSTTAETPAPPAPDAAPAMSERPMDAREQGRDSEQGQGQFSQQNQNRQDGGFQRQGDRPSRFERRDRNNNNRQDRNNRPPQPSGGDRFAGQSGQSAGGQSPQLYPREGQGFRDGQPNPQQPRGGQNFRDGRDSQQNRGFRDSQPSQPRDGQSFRDNRDGRDGRGNQDNRDPRDVQTLPRDGQDGAVPFVSRTQEPQFEEGLVEVSGKGFGFLRESKRNFVQAPSDIFITPEVCRTFNLRDGQWVKGEVRRSSRGLQMFRLTEINGEDVEKYRPLPPFEELTTINPRKRIKLETVPDRYTTRVMDLMTPIGKGQRGLIVAPPRTGKTTLLQHMADAVVKNHPEMKIIILLVDERPEEVTEIRRTIPQAEIMASSNDSDLKNHVRIAQLAMERCKRLVEAGQHVFMLLDSITRMARAFNNAMGGGRASQSGGLSVGALEIPRKIFAAARNTEEAGSLTIMATALIETNSRMDDAIFQEFKGTGNMELVLDRKISDQRIYPAVDIFLSGTRREELLLQPWELDKINVIRRGLAGHKPLEAIERLLSFLKKFPTNAQMLTSLPG